MNKSPGMMLCLAFVASLPAFAQSGQVSPNPRHCSDVHRTQPQYPDSLRGSGIHGSVVMDAVIDENGCAQNVTVVRKLHPKLDELAKQTLRSWKLMPAKKDGEPVRVRVEVSVEFKDTN